MTSRAVFLATAASLALLAGSAAAADEAPITDAPEVTISGDQSSGSWYLRGDLGYSPWTGDEDPSFDAYDATGSEIDSGDFDSARFSKPFSGGVGLGYQFTDVFRADLTTDFFKGDFDGVARSAAPCSSSAPAGTACNYNSRADFRAYGVMANGYVDLATVAGFTPYLGAGLGATNLRWDTLNASANCVDGAASCAGAPSDSARFGGDSSWRFTYALMAGVSYDVSDRVKLDLGYRFSDIAGGNMFGSTGAGLTGRDDGLSRHEFRAGLRIALW
ncbi:porin family protein [Rhizobiaceae bacterium n13]|uniref:Porin family protein n=1 Tax=Ferirhizobium litorale TaxID=2927786 RepID=A0AAE3U292_9HYPH|nr:porin family protein [Fererhizobium litorale]MDI7860596.1 porin family protein [Fererhizobium litorale]MDI7920744.1 porin family protein [Fererhizobium litorale]